MTWIKLFIFVSITSILAGCGFLYGADGTKSDAVTDISAAGWEVNSFDYINQDGEAFGSNDLKGQYWIANMIFASCPTVCLTMTPNMVSLQEEVNRENINLQFISFTVDPDFDGPEGLKKYGQAYGVDFNNFNFLTGYSAEEIAKFAEQSFKSLVQEIPDSNDIMHNVNFFLVDGDGTVVRIYGGTTDFNAKDIIKDLKSIIK
jgi:protein SCO1/2